MYVNGIRVAILFSTLFFPFAQALWLAFDLKLGSCWTEYRLIRQMAKPKRA